jgi:hypothetical protein
MQTTHRRAWVAPRQPHIDHFLKRYRASKMNRSGNGQDRQPQKASRAADDAWFIKLSENLAQATDSAEIYRTQVFRTADAPQESAM